MTSPGINPGQYAARLARASMATGGNRPSVANTLATSDLADSQIDLVGGFINGMDASLVARLARKNGFAASFSPAERAQMDALGEQYDDVDAQGKKDDPRSPLETAMDWTWEHLSGFGDWAVSNPVSHGVLAGLNKALDVVKLPWRMISSEIDTENDDEIAAQMQRGGYDPSNAWDRVQFFYNQGGSLYHDLDSLRESYANGSEMVDLATEYFEDPEAFQQRMITDQAFEARVQQIQSNPDWEDVLDRVDRAHISPGRDVARVLLPKELEGSAGFTVLSGVLDATYTLALDPALVGFKAANLARLADASTGAIAAKGLTQYGPSIRVAKIIDKANKGWYRGTIDNTADIDGLRFAYGKSDAGAWNTQRGKNLGAWWDDVQQVWKAEDKGDLEEAARLVAVMQRRHPDFMPFLQDVGGKRMIPVFQLKPETELLANGERSARTMRELPELKQQIAVGGDGAAEVTIERAGVRSNARPTGIMSSDLAGDWHYVQGARMKDVDEFIEYLAANHALTRASGGLALAQRVVLPGRTAWRRELGWRLAKARYARDKDGAKYAGFYLDNAPTLNVKHQPVAEETAASDELASLSDQDVLSSDGQVGAAVRNLLTYGDAAGGTKGSTLLNPAKVWRRARARQERRLRKIARLNPTVSELDLHNPAHAEQVRAFMGIYMPRTHADLMAAQWRLGDEATRRNIAKSMLEQTAHASGLTLTPQGRSWWDDWVRDQLALDSKQKYGFDGNDVIRTESGDRHVALHLNQLNHKVTLPPIRDMVWLANKFSSASWMARNVGARFMSPTLDAAQTAIKLSWIAWPAGGVRNALDEIGGFGARGMSADVLAGRHMHTVKSKSFRDSDRDLNRQMRRLRKQFGTEDLLRKHLAEELRLHPEDATTQALAARAVENKIQHLIPFHLRGIGNSVNDKLMGVVLGKFLSAFGRHPSEEEYDYARELIELQQQGLTSRVINETGVYDDRAWLLGDEWAQELARQGVDTASVRWKKNGFEQVEPDGGRGADWWAATLHMIFGDRADPAHVAFRSLWEDGDPLLARQKVIDYVNSDAMRYARENMEMIRVEGVEGYADRVVAQAKLATTGRGWPEWDNELIQEIRDMFTADQRAVHGREAARLEQTAPDLDQNLMTAEGRLVAARKERDAARFSVREDRTIQRGTERIADMEREIQKLIAKAKTSEERANDPKLQARVRARNLRLADLAEQISKREAEVGDLQWRIETGRNAGPGTPIGDAVAANEAKLAKAQEKLAALKAREQRQIAKGRQDAEAYGGSGEAIASLNEEIARKKGSLRGVKAYNSFRANRLAGAAVNSGRLDGGQDVETFVNKVLDGDFPAVPEDLIQRLDDAPMDEALHTEVLMRILFHEMDRGHPVYYDAPDLSDDAMRQFMDESGADEVVHPVDEEVYPGVPRDPEEAPSQLEITTPEQLAALLDHLPEASAPVGWSLKPMPPVADQAELTRLEATHKALRAEHKLAKRKVENNRNGIQRHRSLEQFYEHKKPIKDEVVRDYLRNTRGIEPRPGEYNNGIIHEELAQKILNGEIPDRTFLASLPEAYRPRYALKQTFMPVLPGGRVESIANNYTSILARLYKHVVTDMVQAITRNPLFTAKYVMARKNIKAYEDHLVENGWSRDTAQEIAKRIALRHAEAETIKHIDNPTVASQFSTLSRNIWAFERATEDWARRWGRTIRDHPETIRKAQLMLHGGESVGILHRNEDDELTFVYPGSGAFLSAMLNLSTKLLPGQDPVQIPVSPDLESRLTYVNPSLDNPIGFSATPVISIPFKWITTLFGNKQSLVMAAADKVLNGEQGANREWYETLLPTPVARILAGTAETDPATRAGQAMMQAIAQLDAAGAIDELDGNDPGAVEDFYDRLSAQVENNMVFSALFGMFAPASPGLPSNAVEGKEDKAERADWAWHKQGLESLRAEWRKVADTLPFPEAMAWWARNHPGERVWAEAHQTEVSEEADGAVAPATVTAAHWMESNHDWLKRYPGVGAYFIPQGEPGTVGGEFSDVAYNAQLEMGIRKRKDLKQFLTDVITARGERVYYASREDYQRQKSAAERTGNTALAQALEQQWTQVTKPTIYAANPYLRQKFAAYADNEVLRQTQMQNLMLAMNDPETLKAVGPSQAIGVQRLMSAYAAYKRQRDAVKGERGRNAALERARIRSEYDTAVAIIVQEFPGLNDLANGVFGIPD